ncbi:Uso1 / p115 like vesicle tethering protein, head region, partial [Gilliamella apicola SCGC AB-598-I20]
MQKIICFVMLVMLQFGCDNSPLEKNKIDRLVENIGAEKTEKLLQLINQADDEKFNTSKNNKPYDLDDEMAKLHVRYMIGGKPCQP